MDIFARYKSLKKILKANSFLIIGDKLANGIFQDLEHNVRPSLVKNLLNRSQQHLMEVQEKREIESIKGEKKCTSSDSDYSSDSISNRRESTILDNLKTEDHQNSDMKMNFKEKYSFSLLDINNPTRFNKKSDIKLAFENKTNNNHPDKSKSTISLSNKIIEIVEREPSNVDTEPSKLKSFLSQLKTLSSNSSAKLSLVFGKESKHISVNDLSVCRDFEASIGDLTKSQQHESKKELNEKSSKIIDSGKKKTPSASPTKLVSRLISMATNQIKERTELTPVSTQFIGKNKKANTLEVTTDNSIQIISRFPIDSKPYRHYIAGNNNKVDKLSNSIHVNKILNVELITKTNPSSYQHSQDLNEQYDSIKDFHSDNSPTSSKGSNTVYICFFF